MRIGFDYRPAQRTNSRRRGVGRYTRNLFLALLEANRDHHYVAYTTGEAVAGLPEGLERHPLPELRKPSRLNWLLDGVFVPRALRRDRIKLFHAMEITAIPRSTPSTRVWVMVHDLIPLVFWRELADQIPRDYAFALRRGFQAIPSADRVLTNSEYSKKDICERLQVEPQKVHVIYPGVSEAFAPVEPEEARRTLQERFGVEGPFLFYVGGTDHRKNLGFLLSAFHKFRQGGYPGELVLAGETFTWDIPEVRALRGRIAELKLDGAVRLLGFVSDEELANFYSACDLFLFPSLYEGFGLPVLEAMQCGAPVLASGTSSLPEVAGDAAVYFDPRREEELVEVFWKIYPDSSRREEMRRRGFQRAARFSWREAAREVHRLYDRYGG